MRFAVYFFRGLVEFIFGSFVPQSSDLLQPINPVGPIERNIPSGKALQRERKPRDRDERLALLERCWNAEYRVQYPMRGESRASGD